MASEGKLRNIKFEFDGGKKILSFTGKVEKKEMQTGLENNLDKFVKTSYYADLQRRNKC